MYRVMVVDDDDILRKGIITNIDWNAHGFKIVGEARNGQEALEVIEKKMPHILLSDIKMPMMDGLSLVEYTRRSHPSIQCVLLTAYEQFDYVKQALTFQVSDYVLKYESNEVILEAVKKAGKRYDAVKEKEDLIAINQRNLTQQFFKDASYGKHDLPMLMEKQQFLQLEFVSPYMRSINLMIHEVGDMKLSQQFLFRQQCFERLQAYVHSSSIWPSDSGLYSFCDKEMLSFVSVEEEGGLAIDWEAAFIELLTPIAQKHHIEILVGVGSLQEGIDNLYLSYLDAVMMMKNEMPIHFNGKKEKVCVLTSASKNSDAYTPKAMMEGTIRYIQNNYSDADLSLNVLADRVHVSPNYMSTLFKKYVGRNLSDYLIGIRIEEAKKRLAMTDMKAYEIAESIGYTNSQYFSVLFKRETGMSPTDYRNHYKEKA